MMKDSYKMIFGGYVLLALKIVNIFIFQILGALGYLCIGIGLLKIKETKETKIAALGAFGLFVLTGIEFFRQPVVAQSVFDLIIAIIQVGLYIFLNWILIYYMFENIHEELKHKKLVNDASVCEKNKTKFMNLLFYSVLFQNIAFMFSRLGIIFFFVGVILAVYLAIAQVIYMRRISKVL